MKLKTISVSENNYEILRNLGKVGMSFNDVISELISRECNAEKKSLEKLE
jgi:predicted CopG family antitoxin